MKRRDFLRLARRQPRLQLSGEELYMRYVDAKLEDRAESFLRDLEERLQAESNLRLRGSGWLEELEAVDPSEDTTR